MTQFKNKVVLVTGASSGIGKACAEAFAREGARVAIAARRIERLKKLEQNLSSEGSNVKAFKCDIRDEKQIIKLESAVHKHFGPVDILVNNAGVSVWGPYQKTTTQQLDFTFETNVRGLMILSRTVLPSMIKRKTGAIVNISSIAGKIGLENGAIYCASKFAVNGFSNALLEEVRKYNIKVAHICPGMVDTEIHQGRFKNALKDMIQAQDVAQAVLLAASPSETFTISEMLIRPRRPIKL